MPHQIEAGTPNIAEQVQTTGSATLNVESTPDNRPDPLLEYRNLTDVPLRVEALLDCLTMNLRAVAALEVGAVILLNRSAGDNVDLYVNGVPLASGEIMAIENIVGVQITDFVHAEPTVLMEP